MSMRIRADNGAVAARQFGEEVLGAMAASFITVAVVCVVFAPTIVHLLAPGFRDQ
jgi:peptidoglycan biosynthesis protein MviN/MurJ (putative lipid II flippase)